MKHRILLIAAVLLAFTACSDSKSDLPERKSEQQQRKDRNGSLTGDEGLTLFGGRKNEEGGGGAIGVNSFLWRATLDTLSFMPLASADPFGGVIITDWYEDPKAPGERFKVNALILDKTLRADGVKITLFRQKMERGSWRDEQVDESAAHKLEDTILTRARQLKVSQLK